MHSQKVAQFSKENPEATIKSCDGKKCNKLPQVLFVMYCLTCSGFLTFDQSKSPSIIILK